MLNLATKSIEESIKSFLNEDDLSRHFAYNVSLPNDRVSCSLKFKSPQFISGLPFFFFVFEALGNKGSYQGLISEYEGRFVQSDQIHFELPFDIALTGERVALNLLQRSCSISTFTQKFVEKAKSKDIRILDTRKTTPGLRFLEKYATQKAGAFNHRFGQSDMWMIKDNHKSFFGGVKQAYDFFKSQAGMYTPILLEVHDLKELDQGLSLGIKHFMLDNFSVEQIKKALERKSAHATFEVSGGITLSSIDNYLIEGVDAISIGSITYGAPPTDISLKYRRIDEK